MGVTKENYAYDDFGRLSTSTLTHGGAEVMKETYGYRGTSTTTTGQVSTLTITTPGAYQANYAYTYDPNGNIKTVTDAAGTTTYYYDTANQLYREDNQAAGKTWVYTYDNGGNILSRTEYAYTTATTPTGALDTVTYVYGDSNWGDLLTKHDGKTVTSDTNGNMTAYGKLKQYAWEHGRELSTLTQGAPIAIVKQPEDFKGLVGDTVKFSVTARGDGLTYQWQASTNGGSTWNNSTAGGYNTANMSVPMVAGRDGYLYRCKVTDSAGNVRYSEPGEIILVPIVIDSQPQHFYGALGDAITFSVAARGEGLIYRWQVSTNGGSTWGNSTADGYTTDTIYGFDVTESRIGRLYRCKITDSAGNVLYSQPGEIRLEGLYIITQPEDFTGRVGDTVRMSVAAHGTGLTYRWQASTNGGSTWNNSSAGGYNTANMSVPLSETNPGYLYRCKVTDSAGNVVYSEPGKIILATETWTYTYDADGLRTKATNGYNTYEYSYDGGKLTSMKVDDKVLYFFYDGNGKPMFFIYNGTRYFYATNLQGDVTAIVSVSGVIKAEYTYDAWGNILSITGSYADTLGELNPLRYRGYVYDQPTGLYYLQSRYYSPELGRFINADVMIDTEIVLGFNLFAYCGNDPILYIDTTGYGRTYVIYYDNPGSGFYDQAMNSPYYNRNSKNVYMIGVTSNQEFINAWNSMSGTIDYVYLYLHGGKGVLYFKGEILDFSGTQSFSSLNSKKVKRGVYLFSCHGGDGSEGNNVAWMFAKLTQSKVYACTGSVSYSKIFGKYYARKAWDWGIIKTFYYQKRYIFWGPTVAKSVIGQW